MWKRFGLVIPIAERSGLIADLGRHVLELATRQIASWEAEGFGDFYVAVNASARQRLRTQ